jgi:hypothetical protein
MAKYSASLKRKINFLKNKLECFFSCSFMAAQLTGAKLYHKYWGYTPPDGIRVCVQEVCHWGVKLG